MSIPKQPRQQMINLMYLVLTALLALNVSTEALNAFKLINDKLSDSNAAVEVKSASLMNLFQMKLNTNETKTMPYIRDANKVRNMVQEFYAYVDEIKYTVIDASGGIENGKIVGHKNTDVPTRIMIEKKSGFELEKKILELRENLLTLPMLNDLEREELKSQIALSVEYDKTEAGRLGKKSWASYNFERVPVIAAVALLSKLQSDAKEAEARIIEKLYANVDFDTYKFEDLSAKVIAPSSYILAERQEYKAAIFFAGTSKTQNVEVFLGKFKKDMDLRESNGELKNKVTEFPLEDGFTKLDVNDGTALLRETPAQSGEQKRQGVIKIRNTDGSGFNFFPFELEYKAAKPAIVVSPEKINVMYAGVENPLSISVPGFPADRVRAYLSGNGELTGSNGSYVANMRSVGHAKISVNVISDDGNEMKMGETAFRVKRVPNPMAEVGEQSGGEMRSSVFRIQKKLVALIRDFEFDPVFTVTNYKMTWQRKNNPDLFSDVSDRSEFTGNMIEYASQVRPGDMVYFENIRARGPEGDTRRLPDIVFRITN